MPNTPPNESPGPERLGVGDVAKRLGVTPQTVRNRIEKGAYEASRDFEEGTGHWRYAVLWDSVREGERSAGRTDPGPLDTLGLVGGLLERSLPQTRLLQPEELEALLRRTNLEATGEIKPLIENLAALVEQQNALLTECNGLLAELAKNTRVNQKTQERVEEFQEDMGQLEEAQRRPWWRRLFGGN